jgi:hypothetical protein
MGQAQSPLSRLQCLQMKSFRLDVLCALVEQICQIVHRRQSVNMVGAKRSLTLGQAFAKELFSSFVFSFVLKGQRLVLHGFGALGSRS